MKKLLTALSLGLGLTMMFLGGLAAGPPLVAQARDNPPEAQLEPEHNLPPLQAGTGVIRVALTGVDVAGCGSVASPCRTVQFAVDEAIPGDTVLLSAGTWNESVTLSQPISLTGVSSATAIIQALPGQRVLTVTGAAIDNSVVISGLTFSGGDVSGGNVCFSGGTTNCGGGILLTDQAQPTIQNVIIENNNAYLGGGLYANETGGLVLDHVIIRNNSAILAGGGLNAPNVPITITNSLFRQNTTTDNVGGALAASANFNVVAPVFISNTTFLSNTAQCGSSICHAPAVRLFDQDTQIINSHFEGNSCTDPDCDGGGVYMTASFNDPSLSLINNDFINNTAGGKGGGVSVGNLAQVMVVNGRFENNRALSAEGGGLDNSNFLFAAIVTISGTQFISNSAALDGGGLYSVSDIAIANATFESNSSSENGGGLFIDFAGAGSSLTNTEFISNTAGMNGGGAYVSVGDFQVTGGRFEANRANGPESNGAFLITENGGGGLWGGGNVTLSGTEFSGNVAETNGGGAHVRGNVVLNGGRFEQNQSLGNFLLSPGYGGGGLYSLNTLVFTGTIFSGNQAVFLGGGIWTNQNVSGLNGLLQNNTAGSGGGLFTQSSLTLVNSQVISNEADSVGGGALVNGVTTLANVLFQANRVISTAPGTNGGGLAVAGGLTGTNARFIGNRSSGNAGGAFSFGPVNLLDSFFQDNISDGSGGGLGAAFDPVTTYGTKFINNTAELNGGGIAASGAIHSNDDLFQNNRTNTNSGGALHTGGRVFITDTQIISNTAGQNGGGVWANSGLTGINGHIENNSSGSSGGGYYGGQGQINVNGTVFANNQAGGDGGGAYAFDGEAVSKAVFEGNTAAGAGGGLFLERFAHITATQFLGNAANVGGGLAISRTFPGTAVQFVHNSLFARNTATTGGAGIYYNQPRPIDLIHNTIANPATAGGAAIQIITGTVGITNNIIANHATGIEVVNGVVTETYNLFSGNTTNISGVVVGGIGSFTGNPAFQDPANDDYHLTPDSLAINKAVDAGVLTDFDGDPRPGGDGFDIGFDETAFPPVLQVSKTATPNTNVSYRGGLTYTITLSNGSVFDANNVVFTDTLPGEVDFARWVQQPPGANVNADEITWNGTVSGTRAVTFTFVVSHGGDYGDVFTNTAEFLHLLSGTDGSASAQVSIAGPPILAISKTANPNTDVAYQGEVTYTVIISNDGQSEANDTSLTDLLPGEVDFARWVQQPPGANVNVDEITWVGPVPANDAVTFTFVANHVGDYSDVFTNTSSFFYPATETDGSASAQVSIAEPPLLLISKTATPNVEVTYHGEVTYTIIISNNEASDAVKTLLTDTLPLSTTFVRWIEQPPGANVNAGEITWTGPVPANDAVRFTFVVNHTGNYGETVINSARYSQAGNQGSAEAAFTVQPHLTDLLISKSSIRDNEAGLITYSVIVQNLGPTEADGTIISDPIPPGINEFTWQCTATGGASCTVNGVGGINDTLANFPVGSQVVYSVTATMVSTDVTVINEATLIPPLGVTNTAPTNSAIDVSLPLQQIFLPLVIKDFLAAPDLVVDSLSAGQNAVTVTIKNIGNAPVIDGFWVDVYLNPATPSTHVNQHWHDLGDQGLVWGLVAPNIAPGQTITLTLDHQAYRPDLSSFVIPLPIGSSVYAQVDSVNLLTNYGGVLELHEITGGPYNNIAQTTSTAGLANQAALSPGEQPEPTNRGLPPR